MTQQPTSRDTPVQEITFCEQCHGEVLVDQEHCGRCGFARAAVTPPIAAVPASTGFVECPQCAEPIRDKAVVCRFCGCDVDNRPRSPKARALRKARDRSDARLASRQRATSQRRSGALGVVAVLLIVFAVVGFLMSKWVTHQIAWGGVAIFGVLLLILRAVSAR